MATPANRVPVRIARGSKANLDTAIAAGDLKEGEICYATDENGIYVIEGGTLTQAGADLASTSIDALSDVDTTTAAPTDGQVLIWNNVDSEWQPNDLSIDALSDVDTTTAAPTDGQALVWNNSVSQWEPGGVSGEIEWTLTANGTTDYIFAGAGFAGTETDPAIYVMRGQTYKFTNTMGAHPFQVQSTQGIGGTAYNDGITNNAVSNGTLTWEVRMDAPSTLYYQCTSHALMAGVIHVLNEGSAVASIDDLSDVDTSTVAPTDGQALVWDNANSQWEPGTISSGTTLPSAADGEALIYENGQWIAGPVIGGVSYTSAADPEYSNVQLLLHCNGTNGSTTFTDSSQNGLSLSANGNSQISTAQFKFGGASAYFDGANSTISVQDSVLVTGTGQFTIEMWFYASSTDGGLVNSQNVNGGYELIHRNSELKFWAYNSGDVLVATAPSLNAWHHVAVTRDASNVLRMFVDGTLVDSATNFTEWLFKNSLTIGSSRTGFYDFDGYIDDFRLTTGVARYTAAFTPPTAQLLGGGSPVTIPYSIDKLDDVDTSTVAPTDGQALIWDNAAQKWEPGAVSLGVEDLDDFQLQVTPPTSSYNAAKQSDGDFTNTGNTAGGFALDTNGGIYNKIYINKNNPTSGTSLASQGFTAGTSLDLWISADGTTFTQHTATNSFDQGTNNAYFSGLSPDLSAYTSASALYFSLTSVSGTPVALADGDILQYESATAKFRPIQAAGVRSLLDIEEYVDDTAAGTGGLSTGELYYNTTSSSYVLKS